MKNLRILIIAAAVSQVRVFVPRSMQRIRYVVARKSCVNGVWVALLLGLLSNSVVADVHPVKMKAGVIVLPHDTTVNVSLLSEDVTIDILPTFHHVRVVFRVQCHDTAYDSLWIGFPRYGISEGLRDFSARVDGEVVIPYLKETVSEGKYVVFQTSLHSGQQRLIEIEYYQRLHHFPYYWSIDDTLEFYGGYIFRTGASWKGPIQHAVLNVNIMGVDSKRLEVIFPFKPTQTKSGYRFEMFDWEPKHDFEYRFVLLRKEIISMETDPTYSVSSLPVYLQMHDRFIRMSRFIYFVSLDSMIKRETIPEDLREQWLSNPAWKVGSLIVNRSLLHLYDSLQRQMTRSEWEVVANDLIGLARQDTDERSKTFAENALKEIRSGMLKWYRRDILHDDRFIPQRPQKVISSEVWKSAMEWFSAGQETEEQTLLQLTIDDSSYAKKLSISLDDPGLWEGISRVFINVAEDRMNRIKAEQVETAKQIKMAVIVAGTMFVFTIIALTLKLRQRKAYHGGDAN